MAKKKKTALQLVEKIDRLFEKSFLGIPGYQKHKVYKKVEELLNEWKEA